MGEGFSIPRTGAVAPNFGIDTSRSKIRINLYFCKKKCHVERKGNHLEQLFQGSFWKNRNFFKGVFIKENQKRQEAKKASHFFDTRTLFLANLMCDCRLAIRVQFLQHPFYAMQSCN